MNAMSHRGPFQLPQNLQIRNHCGFYLLVT